MMYKLKYLILMVLLIPITVYGMSPDYTRAHKTIDEINVIKCWDSYFRLERILNRIVKSNNRKLDKLERIVRNKLNTTENKCLKLEVILSDRKKS